MNRIIPTQICVLPCSVVAHGDHNPTAGKTKEVKLLGLGFYYIFWCKLVKYFMKELLISLMIAEKSI